MSNKIKVGQIWQEKDGLMYCLTNVKGNNFAAIKPDGRVFGGYSSFENGEILLSTYPTWQEAVNSKEFNQ
ncbi:MAG: hypothetical protein PHE89_02815 [Alphaproteobacteria bacterium]|nr:hypothetical protein [Alphaproteobacteria bacterium]